ncbi:hypothetical protein DXG01_010429 [Tephrocybe rancida]|nr:hypothetical protein DXG01_010429 [Tephrocybe rancida]
MLTLLLLALLLFAIGWVLWRLIAKSELDNVPGPENGSFLVGNLGQLFDIKSGWDFNDMISERYGRVAKVYGPFNSKNLHIYDPKALHHILVKDQAVYEETASFLTFNGLVFGGGLLSSLGDQHKKQRKMLNPVFSTMHMRHMMPLFNDVAERLQKALAIKLTSGAQEASYPISNHWPFIDILHWMSRTALELIGQSGLGYSFDPLVEGAKPHPFSEAVKGYSSFLTRTFIEQEYFLPTLVKIGTPKFRRWVLDRFPFKRYHPLRDIVDTWDRTTTGIFEEKKTALREGDEALANQVGQAKDLMSILMKANSEASAEDALPDKEVLAQVSRPSISTFTFAATDTTSNALSRTLHLLSTHTEVQDRLRTEIVEARQAHGGDIPYDDLVALPLMDAICRETLRLHAPVPRALRDIVLPFSTPIKGLDGKEIDSILVPKNTKMIISILGANRDPLLWGPDALEWKPDRWLSPLPEAVHEARMPGIYSHLFVIHTSSYERGAADAFVLQVDVPRRWAGFRFFPPEKEIVWEMSNITTPTLEGFPGQPRLPLRMELWFSSYVQGWSVMSMNIERSAGPPHAPTHRLNPDPDTPKLDRHMHEAIYREFVNVALITAKSTSLIEI